MSRSQPKLIVEQIRSNNFGETKLDVFIANERHELVVNASAVRKPKSGSRRKLKQNIRFVLYLLVFFTCGSMKKSCCLVAMAV
jgi:hypothetical protein